MSTEQNNALARHIVEEVFNRGNTARVDELLAPDFVEREALPPGMPRSREGVKLLVAALRGAFPDFKATIDDIVAEGDNVVIRQTWTGTQRGEFMGVPPTGKRVSFGVSDILRIAGGKCVEHWGQMDGMGMMQQLGAIPSPGQGGS
ncbi:MAG: ester cyclase [Armatimonadota bacterium]|nr:ester cyclase [Armatimonadota bacterium]